MVETTKRFEIRALSDHKPAGVVGIMEQIEETY